MQLFLKPNCNAPNFLNKFLFSLYWFNSKDWIKTKIRAKVTPQYYKYEILKLEDLYNFEIAKLMHQFTHSKLPLNFNHYFAYSFDVSSYSTRHTSSNDIFLPRFMSSKTQHSIKYIGAKIRNNIPSDLKNASYSKFKES